MGLAHHHHRNAAHPGLAEQRQQRATSLPSHRDIARPIGFHHQPVDPLQQDQREARIQPGEDLEQEHPGVQCVGQPQRTRGKAAGKGCRHPQSAEKGEIGALEGVILGHRVLEGPVAPVELAVEADRHLGRPPQRGGDGIDEVQPGIGAHLAERALAASEDHRAVQSRQQKGESAGGVGQGVRAVRHHRPVHLRQPPGQRPGQSHPGLRLDLAGVEVAEELQLDLGQLRQLGNPGPEHPSEWGWAERGRPAAGHAQSAAGVQEQNAGSRGHAARGR